MFSLFKIWGIRHWKNLFSFSLKFAFLHGNKDSIWLLLQEIVTTIIDLVRPIRPYFLLRSWSLFSKTYFSKVTLFHGHFMKDSWRHSALQLNSAFNFLGQHSAFNYMELKGRFFSSSRVEWLVYKLCLHRWQRLFITKVDGFAAYWLVRSLWYFSLMAWKLNRHLSGIGTWKENDLWKFCSETIEACVFGNEETEIRNRG